MILAVVVVCVSAIVHVACAVFIAARLDKFVRYCQNEPEAHPVRKLFNRIARREQTRKYGLVVRA